VDIKAQQVGVDGPHGPLLRPTSLLIRPGELILVAGEPGSGHTALALALGGQLRPDTGVVLADGRADRSALRARVAVIDAPQVTEPDDGVPLAAVVAEELALAGAPANRRAVHHWLAEQNAAEHAAARFLHVPADVRTRLLTELAAARPGIEVLILDCPDRHIDDPHSWWELARRKVTARRAVVVLCTNTSVRLLDVPAARLGQGNQPAPLELATATLQEMP
jgi:ABC-type hemin transport system ATPase subunit